MMGNQMANVSHIWFHGHDKNKKVMQVTCLLKPSGTVDLKVALPENFYDAVMQCAQTAADAHEAQMRAEILADQPSRDRETA
jgi:hypothetical protein